MDDVTFLRWLAERIVTVYGENPNVDFIHRLHGIANSGKLIVEGNDTKQGEKVSE